MPNHPGNIAGIVSGNNTQNFSKNASKTARVIGFEPIPREQNSQDNINPNQNQGLPSSSQTKDLKNSLITGSRFTQMVKENVKMKNSEVNSNNATIVKSSIPEKRALTCRVINKKTTSQKHTTSQPHPDLLTLGTTRKSMNMIYEQSKGT
jgi:hypothetical protein